jgi:hypothetical protein
MILTVCFHGKVRRGTPCAVIEAPFCYERFAWIVRLSRDVYQVYCFDSIFKIL